MNKSLKLFQILLYRDSNNFKLFTHNLTNLFVIFAGNILGIKNKKLALTSIKDTQKSYTLKIYF